MKPPKEELKGADGKTAPRMDAPVKTTVQQGYDMYTSVKHRIPTKHVVDEKTYKAVIIRILELAAQGIVERSGGVMIDKIGYFCNWMSPERLLYTYSVLGKTRTNTTNGNYWYNTALFTWLAKKNYFKGWYMESAFHEDIVSGIHKQLQKDKRYTMHTELIASINNIGAYYPKYRKRQQKVKENDYSQPNI